MVGPGIWQKKLKYMQNEKHTVQDLEYGKKIEKTWKMRHKHCITWNMARNTENREK